MNRQPLKGLLLFSMFSAKGHILMAFSISLMGAIFSLIFGTTPMFSFIAITFFSTFSLISNASEMKMDGTKWAKFQLSMPVKRRDTITARYIFYILLTIVALIMTGIVESLAHLFAYLNIISYGTFSLGGIGPIKTLLDAMAMTPIQISYYVLLFSIGSALLSCAIYYPLAYGIFKGKEELTALAVLVGNVLITFGLLWLAHRLDFSLSQTVGLGVIIPILLLILSYFLTVKIYQKIDV